MISNGYGGVRVFLPSQKEINQYLFPDVYPAGEAILINKTYGGEPAEIFVHPKHRKKDVEEEVVVEQKKPARGRRQQEEEEEEEEKKIKSPWTTNIEFFESNLKNLRVIYRTNFFPFDAASLANFSAAYAFIGRADKARELLQKAYQEKEKQGEQEEGNEEKEVIRLAFERANSARLLAAIEQNDDISQKEAYDNLLSGGVSDLSLKSRFSYFIKEDNIGEAKKVLEQAFKSQRKDLNEFTLVHFGNGVRAQRIKGVFASNGGNETSPELREALEKLDEIKVEEEKEESEEEDKKEESVEVKEGEEKKEESEESSKE